MRSKSLPFILAFGLLVPILTTVTFFYQQKYAIRKEVKQLLINFDKNKLVHLKFSTEDANKLLDWEHEQEFEFKGEMYDIIETKLTRDTVEYWCWHDHEETELNKSLEELVTKAINGSSDTKDHKQQLENFYKSLICNELHFLWFIYPDFDALQINYYCSITTILASSSSPPPEYS